MGHRRRNARREKKHSTPQGGHVNKYASRVGTRQRLKARGSYVPKGPARRLPQDSRGYSAAADGLSKVSSYTPPKELRSRRFIVTRETLFSPFPRYRASSINSETEVRCMTLNTNPDSWFPYRVEFRLGEEREYIDLENIRITELPLRLKDDSRRVREELREVEGLIFKMKNEYGD